MKQALILVYAILFTLSVWAGEDSTHRSHGTGPAFYDVSGGLPSFAAQD